jgi:hypothetical protein
MPSHSGASSPSRRELQQRIEYCVDRESAYRDELCQEEDMAFHAVAAIAGRHLHATLKRVQQRREKEDGAVERSERTFSRRVQTLEHEEDKRRGEIESQEGLSLDGILRILVRDLQSDVNQVQYVDSQRSKYFNKTVAIIVKNEGNGRRELINSERYEWLVLSRKQDSYALQLQIAEKLRLFKLAQRSRIDRFQQTSSSTDDRRQHRQREASRRARGIADGKKKVYSNVLPRTDAKHSPQYVDRALVNLEERETVARAEVELTEMCAFDAVMRGFNRCEENERDETRRVEAAEVQDAQRIVLRHTRELERVEVAGRQAVAIDERAGRLAIERHVQRETVADLRRTDNDATRHMTHRRKMDDRQQRMALARSHFVERQILLAQADRRTPTEQEIFPVFTPRPPEIIAAHRELQKLQPLTPQARKTADEAVYEELGATLVRSQNKLSVLTRALASHQIAARVVLEKEERLERYALVQCASIALGASQNRVQQAHERRVAEQIAKERDVLSRIEKSDQKSATFKHQRTAQRQREVTLDRTLRDEATARAQIRLDYDGWTKKLADHSATLKRSVTAVTGLVTQEVSARNDLVLAEARFRQTLKTSAAHHKPQSRVVYVEPLPPPKSKFEIIGGTNLRSSALDGGHPNGRRKSEATSVVSRGSQAAKPSPPASRTNPSPRHKKSPAAESADGQAVAASSHEPTAVEIETQRVSTPPPRQSSSRPQSSKTAPIDAPGDAEQPTVSPPPQESAVESASGERYGSSEEFDDEEA